MTKAEREVLKEAQKWWRNHRPIGWRLAMHRKHPDINCPSKADTKLAISVAALRGTEQ